MLGWIGRFLEPLGRPLGLDWRMLVALLSSIVAKENSVATMAVLYNAGEQGLMTVLPQAINHASALSFLVVLMLFIPCLPTITVMRQEMGNWKWFVASFLFMLTLSFFCGMAAHAAALYLGL
jgi:ferrous iron transport protein B